MKKERGDVPELEWLREFKRKSRWSYKKIGSRMGVHPQTIVFWITGKYRPSPMAREKIQKFLDEYYIK